IHHGTTTQQDVSRDQIFPPNKQYDLADANKKIDLINPSCPISNKILGNILNQHLIRLSLVDSASVPWIYTLKLDDSKEKFKFFIDTKEFKFLNELGYSLPMRLPRQFVTKALPQPWQTLRKIFARCLTTRVTGIDQPPFQIMQMMYWFNNNVRMDYAALIWEGLHYSLMHPTAVIPYPKFIKIIVDHFMNENSEIPKRLHENYHRVSYDEIVKSIFNSGKNKEILGMRIPEWMLTKEMKLTRHYQLYSQPIESTHGMHMTPSALRPPNLVEHQATQVSIVIARSLEDLKAQENVKTVEENLVDEEIKKIVEVSDNVDEDEFMDKKFNSQEDPGTRLKSKSHKERPKVEKSVDVLIINDDEEEESAGDALFKKKGKGIVEIKDTPPPTPIRSPRTHTTPLSLDKEKLQELTASDPIPSSYKPTTSSLKPMPIHVKEKDFKAITEGVHTTLKKVVPKMADHNTNDFLKKNLPMVVAEAIRRESSVKRQRISELGTYTTDESSSSQAMNESTPSGLDFKAITEGVHTTLKKVVPKMADHNTNDFLKKNLPMVVAEAIRRKRKNIVAVVRTRDHEDHHHDDARPKGRAV
nr:hypothetical protein [Tanacetum cinerariifolium]